MPPRPRSTLFPYTTLFRSLLEKGKDARLPEGTKFTAYLNGDVPLDRTAFENVQPVITPPSGPATVIVFRAKRPARSEEHTSEPSHLGISYAVFCLKKKRRR